MTLLLFYLVLAIGVSFLCSLCEAVLLTLTISDAEVMKRSGQKVGQHLRSFKEFVDRPLAAILTLNTISHTVGAAGVGAQSIVVFGNAWVGVSSAILTLLILVVSEIIPKTIGATHARRFAAPAVWMILVMMWLTYPVVVVLDAISSALRKGSQPGHLTREKIEVVAELARKGGVLHLAESQILKNMLNLQRMRVRQIMTPRTVIQTAPLSATPATLRDTPETLRFSRIPVTGAGPDDVVGFVLKHDVHNELISGRPDTPIEKLIRPLRAVPENADLLTVMDRFRETGDHMFLVVDEYGGTAGIVSLEDLLETILGTEIVDETDPVPDMQSLARRTRMRFEEMGD